MWFTMTDYTIENNEEISLFADGFKIITAANAQGKAILIDFYYNYLQENPANTLGISLKYLDNSRAWITPDGSICLFYVSSDPNFLFEIKRLLRKYAQSKVIQRTASSFYGYLATDSGMPIFIQEDELLEVKPQEKRKCGVDFYLTSKMYPSLTADGILTNAVVDDALLKQVINNAYGNDEISTSVSIQSAVINSKVYAYTHNQYESVGVGTITFYDALIRAVTFATPLQPAETVQVTGISINSATIRAVVLPANTSPPESVSVTSISVQSAQYG